MVFEVRKIKIFILTVTTLLVFAGVASSPARAREYLPELSGNLEIGDRIQLEGDRAESSEEVIDCDYYQRYWLKYKQQLKPGDYYYYKFQYYHKEYENEVRYSNYSIDLWGNYTYRLTEQLRNGWLLNIRNKDYYWNNNKDYLQLRLKYQLDLDFDQQNDYTFYLQREWQQFSNLPEKDNLYDRVSLSWGYQLSDNFQLDTRFELNRELTLGAVQRSKNGRKLTVGFNWEIER